MAVLGLLLALPLTPLGWRPPPRLLASPSPPLPSPRPPPRSAPLLSRASPRATKHRVIHLYRQAQLLLRSGAPDDARPLLQRCLRLDPTDGHSYLTLARLEAAARRPAAARALFAAGHAACPRNVRLLHAHALLEAAEGQPAAARRLFAAAAAVQPDSAYVSHAWGGFEVAWGNASGARAIYAAAAAAEAPPLVCAAWAALEAGEGEMEEAKAICERGVEARGFAAAAAAEAAELLLVWAELEKETGNVSGSRRLLDWAAERSADAPKVSIARAKLEQRAHNLPAARAILRAAAARAERLPAAARCGWAEVYNAWAAVERAAGAPSAALAAVARGLAAAPRDSALLQTRGVLQAEGGDAAGARESFRRACEIDGRVAAYVAWARLEAAEGQLEEARRLFARGAEVDPFHAPLYSAAARVEVEAGEAAEARRLLEEAVGRRAQPALLHGLGRLEEAEGDLIAAERRYREGIGAARGGGEAKYLWHSLGSVLLARGKPAEAVEAFEQGLRRWPCSSQLLVGAALSLVRQGEHERARSLFLRGVRADERHAHAWQAWGVMEARLSNVDVARELFQRGLRRCPLHAALWQAAAKLEAEAGEVEEARRLYCKGADVCPRSASLLRAWAYFELHRGDERITLDLLRRAKAIEPSAGEHFFIKALLELKLQKFDSARRTIEAGLQCDPTHAPLHRVLGSLHDRAGDTVAARASFRKGIELNPGYAQLYHAWAKLEGRLGNWEGLSEINKLAQRAFPRASEPLGSSADDWPEVA